MDMKKNVGILIGGGVALIATVAIGMGIKTLWESRSGAEPQGDQQESAVVAEKGEEKENTTQNEGSTPWLMGEANEAQAETEEEVAEPEEVVAVVEEKEAAKEEATEDPWDKRIAAFAGAGDSASGEKTWRTVWADLKLTEEEKGRLRQGVMLLIQKWQAMPPEGQLAERTRLMGMRTRFEAMNEEEKLEVSQRLRDRFEEWRLSGQVELPELTLD
jgi:hypothetical protein